MTPASWSRRRRARLNMDPDAVDSTALTPS